MGYPVNQDQDFVQTTKLTYLPSWNQSSSCATRSAVVCYALAHKYEFDSNLLKEGQNKMILSLPSNSTDYESAVLPRSTYVQYDSLRLEVK
jgi:rhamnogalacturonan endolyase